MTEEKYDPLTPLSDREWDDLSGRIMKAFSEVKVSNLGAFLDSINKVGISEKVSGKVIDQFLREKDTNLNKLINQHADELREMLNTFYKAVGNGERSYSVDETIDIPDSEKKSMALPQHSPLRGKPEVIKYTTYRRDYGWSKVLRIDVDHEHIYTSGKKTSMKSRRLFSIRVYPTRKASLLQKWDGNYDERLGKVEIFNKGSHNPISVENFLTSYVSDRNKEKQKEYGKVVEIALQHLEYALYKDIQDGVEQLSGISFKHKG